MPDHVLTAHVCTARCKFDAARRCSVSGRRHRCTPLCQTSTREGDLVCTWTGLVCGSDRVDCSLFNNTSCDREDDLPGRRRALGYRIGSCEGRVRYGPYRRLREPQRVTSGCDPTRHLAASAADSPVNRWLGVARAQARLLFARADVLAKVATHNDAKRQTMLRQRLRQLAAAPGAVVSYTDLAREWVGCLRRYPRLPVVTEQDGVTVEQICNAVATFIVDAWTSLQRLQRWSGARAQPEFESFSLGLIYICREGGQIVNGYPLVPRLPFFEVHTPSIPDLSQMHLALREKDCRNSIIGRRRIMEGRNAISSACATECMARSVADFAVRAEGPVARVLGRAYEDRAFRRLW